MGGWYERGKGGVGVGKKSELEAYFEMLLRSELGDGIPKPVGEYRFFDGRRFRFDYAWLEPWKVAVEIEGGTWVQGGHSRGVGYAKDCEKYNLAVLDGWRVIRFTGDMLKKDGQGCIDILKKVLDIDKEIC